VTKIEQKFINVYVVKKSQNYANRCDLKHFMQSDRTKYLHYLAEKRIFICQTGSQ